MSRICSSLWPLFLVLFLPALCVANITSLTIKEKAGVATSNYPLTFAHVFQEGAVTQGVAVSIDGHVLPTQLDVKRRYADNSVKHGVISVLLPNLQANEELTIDLVNATGNSSSGSMSKSAILSTGVESLLELSQISGSGYSGELTGDLNQTIQDSSSLNYWLAGPVVTEILVQQKLNDSLSGSWEVRFFSGWNGIRISNSVENVEANFRGNVDYSLDILMGNSGNPLASVYSKSTFQHNHNSRWRKVLWIGEEPPEIEIQYDVDYLISTKQILNYDTTVTVSENAISSSFSRWQSSDHDIMGTGYINTYFPTTGDREEIGQLPVWTVRYLLSMDNRMREIMLNHAEMAAGTPVHYRESDSARSFHGHILSIDDRPTVWLGREDFLYQDDEDKLPPPIGSENTPWSVDKAHQTSFAYIPYLITGERYYLDEMYYWSGYNLGSSNWSYREKEKGIIRDQVRGEAWAMRVLAQTSAIAPVDDIEQGYIHSKVLNNISAWKVETEDVAHHPLHTWGGGSCWGQDGGRPYNNIIGCESDRTGKGSGVNEHILPISHTSSPWQDDFMVLSLCHMKELGYDTQSVLTWLGEYTINRFSHPDASVYNGADYRYPSAYSQDVNTVNPRENVSSWKMATDTIIDRNVAFVNDNAVNYPRKAYAALSCLTDISVQQISYDNSVQRNMAGQQAYDWMGEQFNNNNVWNENPNWAIIPRVEIPPVCGNNICETGEKDSCPKDCPVIIDTSGSAMLYYVPIMLNGAENRENGKGVE